MKSDHFHNPILSGFYPDPSICRVNDDYYMVTSSFAYFPGLPLFHSKDLVHWEQIGHGITSPEQLNYKNCETSLGLWAPTIRYHNGTFYIVNTFVSEGREARRDNYIITAAKPEGPWSSPCFIEGADGIDPSLFFDKDGRLWYTGNYISREPLYEGHHGIYLCELDPVTFQIIGQRKIIWDGKISHAKWIEAPHLYLINDYYYLIVAEGGTFCNHSIMMARSRTIDGDYEICPRNPLITHRQLSREHEISVVGHGDLVQTQTGEWWMVLLGIRPYCSGHFNLGRETFLIPIRWDEDGWIRCDNKNGLVNTTERVPKLPYYLAKPEFTSDNFEAPVLHQRWNTIHPAGKPFYSLSDRPGCLRLQLLPEPLNRIGTPAFIGFRQKHPSFRLQAALDFVPNSSNEEAGLALVQDDRYHYRYTVTRKQDERFLQLTAQAGQTETLLCEIGLRRQGRIYLTVTATVTGYHFYYGCDDQQLIPFFKEADPTLLSSVRNEGFTGTYLGMFASSNHIKSDNSADYDWVVYEGDEKN